MTPHERARDIVDTHFPNYARQCVPTSVTDLERAITAALKEQATLLDRSVEQTLGLNTKVLALERTLAAKEAELARCTPTLQQIIDLLDGPRGDEPFIKGQIIAIASELRSRIMDAEFENRR